MVEPIVEPFLNTITVPSKGWPTNYRTIVYSSSKGAPANTGRQTSIPPTGLVHSFDGKIENRCTTYGRLRIVIYGKYYYWLSIP